jgi:hypothetical protein
MKRLIVAALVLAFAGPVGLTRAADKPDPTGTWKWTITMGDQKREVTLKLKLEGDKLNGAVIGPDGKEGPIEDATYKDGEVAFKVTRQRDGNKFTIRFKGKLNGDTLKGKSEINRNGETQTREWEAKRDKG